MRCHGCNNTIKGTPYVCSNCEFTMYCNGICAQSDWDMTHGHHVCESNIDHWDASSVRAMVGDVVDWNIQQQMNDFLTTNEPRLEDFDLRDKIINDLYVSGKIFRNYIRPILKSKRLRKGVIKKLERGFVDNKDYRGRVKHYSKSQAADILYVIDKTTDYDYDNDGSVRDAYNKGLRE